MSLVAYYPDRNIPQTALYFTIRGLHGQRTVATERVDTIRSFARRHPELGQEAENLIAQVYGVANPLLAELERRYAKLSQSQKISFWQSVGDDAAKLFVQGQLKRVLKFL